jgi:acetyl-CoA carboxylase biotin carboxyl carrier protein
MAGSSPSQDIFDVRKIRRLVELMKEHDLSEMELRQGEMQIQLRRREPAGVLPTLLPAAPAPPAAAPSPAAPTAETPGADAKHLVEIKSPMVGTFYSAPDPESPPYVKVGDHVGPDTTVCIVEAMKVFNQIPAEVAGKIAAVLVDSGDSVEFGQPLFRVDTRE